MSSMLVEATLLILHVPLNSPVLRSPNLKCLLQKRATFGFFLEQYSQHSDYATGWKIEEFLIPNKAIDHSYPHSFQTGSESQAVSYQMCSGTLFPRVKPPGCRDDHSLPSSAKVKNVWNCISTPSCASMS
jgi:hypothetical protein